MERKPRKVIQFISFISMFVIGVVLLLNIFFKNSAFVDVLKNIAYALAFIVVIANAFFYVRTKRSNIYTLLYFIGVLLLIICFVVPFII